MLPGFKLKNILIEDPSIEVSDESFFPIIKGGIENNYTSFSSNSYGTVSTNFSVIPPSLSTGVHPNIKLYQPITIDFVGDSGDDNTYLLQSGNDALRDYCLQSVMNSLTVSLNGSKFSLEPNNTTKPLLTFNDNYKNIVDRANSMTPSMLDQSQTFEQVTSSLRNPLSSVFDSSNRDDMPRGSFPLTNFQSDRTTASISANIVEDLMISPLTFSGNDNVEAFYGLQKIDVTISWSSKLYMMWCHSNANPNATLENSGLTISFGQPLLLLKYITPPSYIKIPLAPKYPYNQINYWSSDVGDVNSKQEVDSTSQSIQLQTIPRFLYIFARKKHNSSNLSINDTTSYLSIEQVNVNWNNKQNLLSNATKQQLYDISRRNGLSMSWTEWSGEDSYFYIGNTTSIYNGPCGPLCLEMGRDIGLYDDECPGMIGQYNLQVKVKLKNQSPNLKQDVELVLMTREAGVVYFYNNQAFPSLGAVTKNDVKQAVKMTGISYGDLSKSLWAGGNIFRKIKKLAKKGKKAFDEGKSIYKGVKAGVKKYEKSKKKMKNKKNKNNVMVNRNYEVEEPYERQQNVNNMEMVPYSGSGLLGGALSYRQILDKLYNPSAAYNKYTYKQAMKKASAIYKRNKKRRNKNENIRLVGGRIVEVDELEDLLI